MTAHFLVNITAKLDVGAILIALAALIRVLRK